MAGTVSNAYLNAHTLRNLYYTRTVVQLLWAAVVLATAVSNPPVAAALLILYPLWDVACTIYDLRAFPASSSNPATTRYLNIAMGTLAAAGIAATVFTSPERAVLAFGIWALAAGLAQFAVALSRRKTLGGGQWAMILSGVQSAAAGIAFILGALDETKHIKDLGGYAVFGGVYFLIAGILLHRKLPQLSGTSNAIA
jgi:uncharacterized membrane protein HdeD (DUF308 family)